MTGFTMTRGDYFGRRSDLTARLRQGDWVRREEPDVGRQCRNLACHGPVSQYGRDWPGAEPDILVGDSAGVVEVENVDPVLGAALDHAAPLLHPPAVELKAGVVSARTLDAADQLVN